jgi:hypothetical protein
MRENGGWRAAGPDFLIRVRTVHRLAGVEACRLSGTSFELSMFITLYVADLCIQSPAGKSFVAIFEKCWYFTASRDCKAGLATIAEHKVA